MESSTENQLKADLMSAEQEITFVIENQEIFYKFLKQKMQENTNNYVIQEIITKFEQIMI